MRLVEDRNDLRRLPDKRKLNPHRKQFVNSHIQPFDHLTACKRNDDPLPILAPRRLAGRSFGDRAHTHKVEHRAWVRRQAELFCAGPTDIFKPTHHDARRFKLVEKPESLLVPAKPGVRLTELADAERHTAGPTNLQMPLALFVLFAPAIIAVIERDDCTTPDAVEPTDARVVNLDNV